MTDLMSILSTGNANIKLEITGEDLRNFSEELISRAVNEVAMVMQDNKEDCLLTKEETKKRLGVCDATLWHWDKKGYLKPVKVGSKVKYRESDVKKILGVQNKSFGNYGKDLEQQPRYSGSNQQNPYGSQRPERHRTSPRCFPTEIARHHL